MIPSVNYRINVEVLLNDLSHDHEKVKNIEVGGIKIGECNPNQAGCDKQGLAECGDFACIFYDCTSYLDKKVISFDSETTEIKLEFQEHSQDCDCDESTWECKKENEDPSLTPTLALARITLIPVGKHYIAVKCSKKLVLKDI